MAGKKVEEHYRCSFCGKPQEQVQKLIAGPNNVFICDECVDVCAEIIEEEYDEEFDEEMDVNLLKPMEISKPSDMDWPK